MPRKYSVNEFFYSLQGEGMRAGEASLFLRFAGCNLRCEKETHGFDCDTEFVSSHQWELYDLIDELKLLNRLCRWVILTGGEPTQQVDLDLIQELKEAGYRLAIETNGTNPVLPGIDWITVSPKVAEHAIKQRTATEVKYVRAYGQGIPRTVVEAKYYLISPAFDGQNIDPKNLAWCIKLCKENPKWRLSCQNHKAWNVR
jgi:7-carboxy-7-deazaguanine synthase